MIKLYRTPLVTLLSSPQFFEPKHLPVQWLGEATDGERLAEYAGRACYMSQANSAKRTTAEYLENIKQLAHFSVLEHANYSFLFEGVSRSLSHELVRHRHQSPSQLSQRYVDESDVGFVVPVAILGDVELEAEYAETCARALDRYTELVDTLLDKYASIASTTERRKKAREAAREVLPNGTETKLVVTGNARTWRHFLRLRGSLGADAQIARLAVEVFKQLNAVAPGFFGDFSIQYDHNQRAHLVTPYAGE